MENSLANAFGMLAGRNAFAGNPLEQRIISAFKQCVGGLPDELLAHLARTAIAEIRMHNGEPLQEGHIAMPKNADEAVAMALVGEAWLKANAPDRLRQPV